MDDVKKATITALREATQALLIGDKATEGEPKMLEQSMPGVADEVTDKIFDPFFTTKPQGSGLGLAIVRKIVDAHDGRIDLTSTRGAGTRFRVTLPVGSAAELFK